MNAQILTRWKTGATNGPRLPDDHALPAGTSWMDVTGQQSYQIPTLPDAYVIEVWDVSDAWLDSVAADSNYRVLWRAEEGEPAEVLTTEQLDAVRAYFAMASSAQLDLHIGTTERPAAEVAADVREWSRLFLRQDEMEPDDYARLVNRYPAWEIGVIYVPGVLLAYADALYEVVQGHTSQSDWTPDVVPALFVVVAPQGVIPAWVQPTHAGDSYPLGAKVTHNGQVWESLVNANVWEPGTPGTESLWTQVG